MICGNCKCYSSYQTHARTGRCRRYNIVVQLRTRCLDKQNYSCKCMVRECMDRKGDMNDWEGVL